MTQLILTDVKKGFGRGKIRSIDTEKTKTFNYDFMMMILGHDDDFRAFGFKRSQKNKHREGDLK